MEDVRVGPDGFEVDDDLNSCPEALLASGTRYWDPEDRSAGGRGWWIVRGPCSDQEALYASDCPSARYGGPGRQFAEGPRIRRNRSGTRVLVTQNFGWDI